MVGEEPGHVSRTRFEKMADEMNYEGILAHAHNKQWLAVRLFPLVRGIVRAIANANAPAS